MLAQRRVIANVVAPSCFLNLPSHAGLGLSDLLVDQRPIGCQLSPRGDVNTCPDGALWFDPQEKTAPVSGVESEVRRRRGEWRGNTAGQFGSLRRAAPKNTHVD